MRILLALTIATLAASAAAACGGTDANTVSGGNQSGSDAGGDDDAGDPNAIYDTPLTCTSNTKWTRGDRGSELMHPGRACIECHLDNGGPPLTIAGTVYPTAHEPDDCNGVAKSITVVITDAKGKVTNLKPNSAGNFYALASIAKPFAAKVVSSDGKERVMDDKQTSGDCNSCHTVNGANDAPGRIMAP